MQNRFYTQKPENLDTKTDDRIKPEGLLHVVAMLDKLWGKYANTNVFCQLVLIFENTAALKAFKAQVYARAKDNQVEVPMLHFNSWFKIAGMQNEERFLDVKLPLNGKSYFLSSEKHELTGKLMLEELSKHVDLSGINKIVYNSDDSSIVQQSSFIEPISPKELIAEFNKVSRTPGM